MLASFLFSLVGLASALPSIELSCPTGFKVEERRYGDFGVRKICIGKAKSSDVLPEKVIRAGQLWLEEGPLPNGSGKFSKVWSERGQLISETEEKTGKPECVQDIPLSEDDIVVGYVKGESFFALASTRKNNLVIYNRLKKKGAQDLYGVGELKANVEWSPVQMDEIVFQCVYSGKLKGKVADFSPLSNRKGTLREPTEKEKNRFVKEYSDCIRHGDFDEGDPRGCEKKQLKAVSDINKDGIQEFWYRAPFIWDIGYGMVEFDSKTDKFFYFAEKCDYCAD